MNLLRLLLKAKVSTPDRKYLIIVLIETYLNCVNLSVKSCIIALLYFIFYPGFDDKETCGKNKHLFSCF